MIEDRVEHRRPDGSAPELLRTTTQHRAERTAETWVTLLRSQGKPGEVVVLDQATGAVIRGYPVDEAPLRRRASP